MGQKVHPVGFRLGLNHDHSHVACVPNKLGPQVYFENYLLRQWLHEHCVLPTRKDLYSTELTRIKICRTPQEVNPQKDKREIIFIDVWTNTPARVLQLSSRYGLDEVRNKPFKMRIPYAFKHLEGFLLKRLLTVRPENAPFVTVRVGVVKPKHICIASLISQKFAYYLARREKFRVWMRKLLNELKVDNAKFKMTAWLGLRVDISGRINGAEMARTETLRYKSLPCQTLRAPIEYHCSHANTKYGLLGIKVWIYIDPKTSLPDRERYILPVTQRFAILNNYEPQGHTWYHRSNYERSYILNEFEWLRPYLIARAKKKSKLYEQEIKKRGLQGKKKRLKKARGLPQGGRRGKGKPSPGGKKESQRR